MRVTSGETDGSMSLLAPTGTSKGPPAIGRASLLCVDQRPPVRCRSRLTGPVRPVVQDFSAMIYSEYEVVEQSLTTKPRKQ
jgi:hypothetical protein